MNINMNESAYNNFICHYSREGHRNCYEMAKKSGIEWHLLPKNKRLFAILGDFPFLSKADLKELTNLGYGTIEKFCEENEIQLYAEPDVNYTMIDKSLKTKDEKTIACRLFCNNVTVSELKRLSRYKLWCKLGKPYHFPKEMIPSKYGGSRKKPVYLEGENILENIFSFCEKHYILKEDY